MIAIDEAPSDGRRAATLSAETREQWSMFGLALPALLIVGFLVFLPVGWLFGLSLVADGQPSLVHYRRLLEPAYLSIFTQTFQISFQVTAMALLLGYPLAYLLSQIPRKVAGLLMICVMLPFWTSILVRTYAWMVLLQRRGIINGWLIDLGLIDRPLSLVNNYTGTVIGMLHVMLPFMILPLYSALVKVDTSLMRAASNLGATPMRAFFTVFLPLSMPGVIAGTLLVFVLCLGFYVTPALLGGGRVIMVSMKIQQNAAMYFDWGAASALGVVLLAATALLFWVISRVTRIERLFGGS
ncbi:putative spermidine/putrescine transport system permease protein [Palleronia aestuarii]|uniref:Putative spermidine/putrescine transport system permease protein n=1 Tax=Palleronia aestuarii TaxID=568105 RepID=A0A2W7N422_9RHOB|nr:ABC transporter permease [Palleronia aestuarii]PZX13097.1 putative spermidine/putrescine transport system permease protein [Palleronia aestuarii]